MTFGRHIENKLNETDEKGRPKYTLYELLDIPDPRSEREKNQSGVDFLKTLATMPGAVRIIRVK